jgi:hypothetical protein
MKTQKQAANKILWFFAIGQLGWSILSGIITNWLVFFYQPSTQAIKDGAPLHITQGAVLGGLTVIGLIAAVGRIFDAVTDPWIASCSDRCRHQAGTPDSVPALRGGAAGHHHRAGVFLPGRRHQAGEQCVPAGHGSALLPLYDAVLHAL